jgi:hypothetical protein
LSGGTATAAQIEFINIVVEHLTDQRTLDPALLYDPRFTDNSVERCLKLGRELGRSSR